MGFAYDAVLLNPCPYQALYDKVSLRTDDCNMMKEISIFGIICHVLLLFPLAVWFYRLCRNKKIP